MIDILEEIAVHIATALSLTPGAEIVTNEMPDVSDRCVLVQHLRPGGYVVPQIDADTHHIQIVAREASNVAARQLAMQCYTTLLTETGLVDLPQITISVELLGTPIWQQSDQQARKYFYFQLKAISKRLN